jgi:hypothetical protein
MYLLKLLFKTARLGWSKYADSHRADYTRIRRQWAALAFGAVAACPVALVVIIWSLGEPFLGVGQAAAHAPPIAIAALLVLALIALGIGFNILFPIMAVFVLVSLAYDAYKLRRWISSKAIALCMGAAVLGGIWYWCSLHTGNFFEDLGWADLAPFLSSAMALMLIFIALTVLPKPRAGTQP